MTYGKRSRQNKQFSFCLIGLLIATIVTATLNGCSSGGGVKDGAPVKPRDVSRVPDAKPKAEPHSKYGNNPSYVVNGKRYYVKNSAKGYVERGVASWYGTKFHGRRTSSGEPYDMYAMTAAHRSLPLPTYVEVTNLGNRRKVVVKVNDRGPFHSNRIIDLSYSAAKKLGITANGTGLVEVRAIDPRAKHAANSSENSTVGHASNRTSYELFLQVGAFLSRSNADRLRNQLVGVINTHNIKTGYSETDKLYRVRIGPIASVETADRLAQRITGMGIAEPQVIIN